MSPVPGRVRFDCVKSAVLPVGSGYDARPDQPLTDIVWHSTEHPPGQSFAAVCVYLQYSGGVSAHYAIGPDGTIQRILDPGPWRAWHAGYSRWPRPPLPGRRAWNDFAVGIELYHRQGDGPYPAAQLAAAGWLRGVLRRDHPTIQGDVCHRWIATNPDAEQPPVRYGRKIDPSDWPDAAFRAWLAALDAP